MITSRSLLPGGSGAGTSTSAPVGKNILRHFHLKKRQKLLLNTILKSINKKGHVEILDQSIAFNKHSVEKRKAISENP
ncbi:MAG TPA: hypothetical protein PKC27_06240, partial [Methanomethylovorans sp.]|nr:hypothetical protein [Methanomethylovorans sp.]